MAMVREKKDEAPVHPAVTSIVILSRNKNNFKLKVDPGNRLIERNKEDILWLQDNL